MNKDEEFKHIREAFSSQGTRVDYIFDVLKSLDGGIKGVMNGQNELGYIREKLRSLGSACEMIQHDTLVYLYNKKLITNEQFDSIKESLKR